MKKQTRTFLYSALALALGLLLPAVAQANQERLATAIAEARSEASRTSDQLASTLAAVTALTKQTSGDLRPAYDAFAAQIPKTEAAAASTRTRVEWMNGQGQEYFTAWQNDVNTINNSSLKKKAQKRLDAVKKSYTKVNQELSNAGSHFKPFLSDLQDIQKALANDVTPGGVKAIKRTVNSANFNHKKVNGAMQAALAELRKMESLLSSGS